MVILITGASGLIGSALTEFLLKQGHSVVHLGRSPRTGKVPCYAWDIQNGKLDARALKDAEVNRRKDINANWKARKMM